MLPGLLLRENGNIAAADIAGVFIVRCRLTKNIMVKADGDTKRAETTKKLREVQL